MAATPSPNLNDQSLLAAEPGFIGRVQESLAAACSAIANEVDTTAYHYARLKLAAQIMQNLFNTSIPYAKMFAVAVATDSNVIGDATVSGGTPLTTGNVAAQGLLVTDVHMNAAVSGQFNSFLNKAA